MVGCNGDPVGDSAVSVDASVLKSRAVRHARNVASPFVDVADLRHGRVHIRAAQGEKTTVDVTRPGNERRPSTRSRRPSQTNS